MAALVLRGRLANLWAGLIGCLIFFASAQAAAGICEAEIEQSIMSANSFMPDKAHPFKSRDYYAKHVSDWSSTSCSSISNIQNANKDNERILAQNIAMSSPGDLRAQSVVSLSKFRLCVSRATAARCNSSTTSTSTSTPSVATSIDRTSSTNPAPANSQGASVAGLSQQQISACSEEIKRKQIESQSWGGDANDVAARLGQFQKNLFEGKCSGHPEAQAYIAGANKMLGYGGSVSKPSTSTNIVTPGVSHTASSRESVGTGGPEYVRIQSNVKCAYFKIVSEKPVSHTPYKTVVFSIQNTCNAPMYIRWAVYQGQRSTVMVDYQNTRDLTPSGNAYFKPREVLKSMPYDFDYSDNPPLKVVFTQVCPIESEASKIAGRPLGNINARPEQPDICIGLVLKSTDVPTAN